MDTNDFERLAKEHLTALYSYCLAKTCDVERAEELAQETLYRAHLSFHRLKNQSSFESWLIGIAKRCSWSWFRQAKRDPLCSRANETGTDFPETIMDPKIDPRDRLAMKEKIRATLKAVKKLSKRNREVIILRYFEQLGYTEMAHRLGISVDAVDQRLTRARFRLRRLLSPLEI